MTDLKPCLYCGGEMKMGYNSYYKKPYWMLCADCRLVTGDYKTEQEAIAAHNAAALKTRDKEVQSEKD